MSSLLSPTFRLTNLFLTVYRSGQVYGLNGSLTIATKAHAGKIISDHIIRIALNKKQSIRTGYVYVALSHPKLRKPLVKSLAYGSSIPEIDPTDMAGIEIVRLEQGVENAIADLAEKAFSLAGHADMLEKDIASEAERFIDSVISRK